MLLGANRDASAIRRSDHPPDTSMIRSVAARPSLNDNGRPSPTLRRIAST
jgi:hypothetical protein